MYSNCSRESHCINTARHTSRKWVSLWHYRAAVYTGKAILLAMSSGRTKAMRRRRMFRFSSRYHPRLNVLLRSLNLRYLLRRKTCHSFKDNLDHDEDTKGELVPPRFWCCWSLYKSSTHSSSLPRPAAPSTSSPSKRGAKKIAHEADRSPDLTDISSPRLITPTPTNERGRAMNQTPPPPSVRSGNTQRSEVHGV